MAKFGIALGSGPRGRGFESRYSDQILKPPIGWFFYLNGYSEAKVRYKKTCRWHVFMPWETPLVFRCILPDVDKNQTPYFTDN